MIDIDMSPNPSPFPLYKAVQRLFYRLEPLLPANLAEAWDAWIAKVSDKGVSEMLEVAYALVITPPEALSEADIADLTKVAGEMAHMVHVYQWFMKTDRAFAIREACRRRLGATISADDPAVDERYAAPAQAPSPPV